MSLYIPWLHRQKSLSFPVLEEEEEEEEEQNQKERRKGAMASTVMVSSAAVASSAAITRTAPSQYFAPFSGLKSTAAFPVTKKPTTDFSSLPSNGGRVQCMKVWEPYNNQRFETLSYLPPLNKKALAKEVDYLIRNGWIPCLEFDVKGWVSRDNNRSPGYYDGRYWTMWKLPMFGCTDSSQVMAELEEATKSYPDCYHRIIGFDNKRQVQCISFLAYKPPPPPS
ncbi:ribulose bisphosphate carboxylase small chain SSU5A, chloroplastic [Amborella trichopoda]|nr:ribulose bisphosphate carboxylase small chain SSU5A, chloroplastic [Amborella trichopoda]|eukprot:XP_006842277.2 ribulose bisphosphate carboxylase small chain SSU5A, chloroplastic [Amborella trichopoda]